MAKSEEWFIRSAKKNFASLFFVVNLALSLFVPSAVFGDLIDEFEEEGVVGVQDAEPTTSGKKKAPKNSSSRDESFQGSKASKSSPPEKLKDLKGARSGEGAETAKPNPSTQETPSKLKRNQNESPIGNSLKDKQEVEPVIFEGDHLSGIRRLGTLELQENVKISQGDLFLDSNTAKIFFDEVNDEVKKVLASGSVKMKKNDPQTGDPITASSDKIEFDAIKQVIKLIGRARMTRAGDIIRGQTIDYDLKTGLLKASNVRGVVKPEDDGRR